MKHVRHAITYPHYMSQKNGKGGNSVVQNYENKRKQP